jgi:LysR family transcriptional regulator, regulator for bpeEF and oprC
MSQARVAPRGRIRVDVPGTLGRGVLIPALPRFHEKYPDIQIDMGVSDRPVDLISDNVDCVVRGGELLDQSLVARRVGELNYICCAAPSYLKRLGVPQRPEEIEGEHHHVVSYFSSRTGRVFPWNFQRGEEKIEVHGRYNLAVNDGGAYIVAGVAGLGLLRVPHFMAEPHLLAGELVPVLQDWQFEPLPLYIVYPPNRHLSSKVRVFVDWVVELLAEKAPLAPTLGAAR